MIDEQALEESKLEVVALSLHVLAILFVVVLLVGDLCLSLSLVIAIVVEFVVVYLAVTSVLVLADYLLYGMEDFGVVQLQLLVSVLVA